eukprot:1634064-Pleurochrysis_carterae.AAC.2
MRRAASALALVSSTLASAPSASHSGARVLAALEQRRRAVVAAHERLSALAKLAPQLGDGLCNHRLATEGVPPQIAFERLQVCCVLRVAHEALVVQARNGRLAVTQQREADVAAQQLVLSTHF